MSFLIENQRATHFIYAENFFSSKNALFFVLKTYVFSNFRFKPLSNFLPYNNARTHSYALKELREAMQGIYIYNISNR